MSKRLIDYITFMFMCLSVYLLQKSSYCHLLSFQVWIVPSTFAAHKMYQNSISVLYEVVALVYGAALFSLFTVSTAFHLVSLHKDLQ